MYYWSEARESDRDHGRGRGYGHGHGHGGDLRGDDGGNDRDCDHQEYGDCGYNCHDYNDHGYDDRDHVGHGHGCGDHDYDVRGRDCDGPDDYAFPGDLVPLRADLGI